MEKLTVKLIQHNLRKTKQHIEMHSNFSNHLPGSPFIIRNTLEQLRDPHMYVLFFVFKKYQTSTHMMTYKRFAKGQPRIEQYRRSGSLGSE